MRKSFPKDFAALLCSLLLLLMTFAGSVQAQSLARELRVQLRVDKADGPTVQAGLRHQIEVIVTDQDGRRVPNALIFLSGPGATAITGSLQGLTGSNGTFSTMLQPDGAQKTLTLRAKATFEGLESQPVERVLEVTPKPAAAPSSKWWVVAGTTAAATTLAVLVGQGKIGRDPKREPTSGPTTITIFPPTLTVR